MNNYSIYLQTFFLALFLLTSTNLSATAIAKTPLTQDSPKPAESWGVGKFLKLGFKVGGVRPSRRRTGGLSRGGAVNGSCSGEPISVTTLLPKNNESQLLADKEIEIESTIAAHPTFFIHISQTPAQEAEFVIQNEQGDEIVHQTFPLPGTPGIVKISIPPDQKALEVGKLYHWSFAINCSLNGDSTEDVVVDGWVQRLDQPQLETDSWRRLEYYANNDIWMDTVSTLAELMQASPNDSRLQQEWRSLLESVKLNAIVEEPIVQ